MKKKPTRATRAKLSAALKRHWARKRAAGPINPGHRFAARIRAAARAVVAQAIDEAIRAEMDRELDRLKA